MKCFFLRALCLFFCVGGCCYDAIAQGCGVAMTRNYSVYNSISIDSSDHIYTSVLVDGSANCYPNPGCPCGSAQHTPKALNTIGTVGGWGSGAPQCVNCYLSYQNNQSMLAAEGTNYNFYGEGQIICSLAGLFFDFQLPVEVARLVDP